MELRAPIIEISKVTKTYDMTRALTDVSICLTEGEVRGLLGPNGAGKTTLFGIAAGVIKPDSGHVGYSEHGVALAGQQSAFVPSLTVIQNVNLMARLYGLHGTRLRARVRDTLRKLDLLEVSDRRVRNLSGGQQRRVHVSMALVADVPVLLLDEPTIGADVESRHQIVSAIETTADRGTAIIYTSHYLDEVMEIASEIDLLVSGEMRFSGTLKEFLSASETPFIELEVVDADAHDPRHIQQESRTSQPETELAQLVSALASEGTQVIAARIRRPSIEAAYRIRVDDQDFVERREG